MIAKAEKLSDIVPRMQEMLARMQFDRSSLDQLREVFGLQQVGQDINLTERENNELVGLVRAYAIKEGIVPSNPHGGQKTATFVTKRQVTSKRRTSKSTDELLGVLNGIGGGNQFRVA